MMPNKIILHFSDTDFRRDIGIKELSETDANIRDYYHYVIRLDGEVEKGVSIDKEGKFVFNRNGLGICIVGGRDSQGKRKDTRTHRQKETLYYLVGILILKFDISPEDIYCDEKIILDTPPRFTNYQFKRELESWLMDDLTEKQ